MPLLIQIFLYFKRDRGYALVDTELVNWDRECDRALQRIEDEQNKMRIFKEDVVSKFGDIMDDEYGLMEDDDDDYNKYDNNNRWNNNNNNNLGGFKLDNDVFFLL
eukprot:529459_1